MYIQPIIYNTLNVNTLQVFTLKKFGPNPG